MVEAFPDILVLYRSDDGRQWVAHSIQTDQIGVGEDRHSALRELVEAVRVLLSERERDPNVAVFQPAPLNVLQKIQSSAAAEIPEEVWERIRRSASKCDGEGYWTPDRDEEDEDDQDRHDVFFRQVKSSELVGV